jgi:hypothetical protein
MGMTKLSGIACDESTFHIDGDSGSVLMGAIEQVIAAVPDAEVDEAREILVAMCRILYGADFQLVAQNARDGGDTAELVRLGLYRGVGALVESSGGDMPCQGIDALLRGNEDAIGAIAVERPGDKLQLH